MKLVNSVACCVWSLLVFPLAQIHGQVVPPQGELPVALRAQKVPGGNGIELVVPKSDTAGVVELYGASDVSRLLTQPDSIVLTNTPVAADLYWPLPNGSQGFYRALMRNGVTLADYLPRIASQPQGAEVEQGGSMTLSVTATALTAQTYQWQFNGESLPGQNGATLTLTNFTGAAQGEYKVIVSSAAGTVASETARVRLQVAIPPTPDGFVWIQPGTFVMGSPQSDPHYADQTQHTVTLTRGFFIGRYEVTQLEYTSVMGVNPSWFRGDSLPVEQVSWFEATNYCFGLTVSERGAGRLPEGWEYRLPTEAQWEYACRSGTTTATAFGNTLSGAQANFWGLWPSPPDRPDPNGVYKGRTTPVGSYAANAWGLYDMHGNVWEWCADSIGDYPRGSVTDPTTPPPSRGLPVIRGGSWRAVETDCRSSYRIWDGAGAQSNTLGFRVVLVRVQ